MNEDEHRLNAITERIIGCAFEVANTLGVGFLEKVYENSLSADVRRSGMKCLQQFPIPVFYKGDQVGDYAVDLLIEDVVLVELKVAKALDDIHMAQCLNYLRATGKRICLLINFGKPKIEIKRIMN